MMQGSTMAKAILNASADEFAAYIRSEFASFSRLAKEAKLKVE